VHAHSLGEVGNLGNFLDGLFLDSSSHFYWNRFIFDRQGAIYKLAQFFETRCSS